MKFRLAFILFIAIPVLSIAGPQYDYFVDIKNIENDRVSVKLTPPEINEDMIIYSFPRVIPGSYSEKNFGIYIDEFSAKNKNGQRLKVVKLNSNQYEIRNAKNLASISYKVNDTWDKPSKDFIFQPGGTNIEADKNVVMNNHAFFGYFEGYRQLPVMIHVTKPDFMYAATHLITHHQSSTSDLLKARNYFDLVDNPVFYAAPDTTSFMVGATKINVAVISARDKVKSKLVASYLQPLAKALDHFFGGLPVTSYQFLFFFDNPENVTKRRDSGGFGALEHNYSSLYYLPEIGYEPKLKSLVLEVTSHEFLHILTPLNLHSEEIEDFDFINPKMSKHLWLYEGVTEYFAQLTQLQHGLLTPDAFFSNMRDKINEAEKYGNFSLTQMSEHVLENNYKDKYNSVYNKGALTAMMLDIVIRSKTAGTKDLKSVITMLTKRYGPGKPFKDDELFDELVAVSDPGVRQFIDSFIIGDKPLPYKQLFSLIGYQFSETKRIDAYYNGGLALKYDEANEAFVFTEVDKKNALEINDGDVLLAVNATPVTSENAEPLWEKYFKRNTLYPELSLTVKRAGVTKELSGNLYKGYFEAKNYLEPVESADESQLKLRESLMEGM